MTPASAALAPAVSFRFALWLLVYCATALVAQTIISQPLHGPDAHSAIQHAEPRPIVADDAARLVPIVLPGEAQRALPERGSIPESSDARPPEHPPR